MKPEPRNCGKHPGKLRTVRSQRHHRDRTAKKLHEQRSPKAQNQGQPGRRKTAQPELNITLPKRHHSRMLKAGQHATITVIQGSWEPVGDHDPAETAQSRTWATTAASVRHRTKTNEGARQDHAGHTRSLTPKNTSTWWGGQAPCHHGTHLG